MNQLRNDIKKYISGKRYEHTLAVERESVSLAEIFGLSREMTKKLRIAALLHDITKEKKTDEQTELCRRFNISYDETDIKSPKVFHAVTGAALAKNDYPSLVDDDIYNAILSHTVGNDNMTLFDQILYLADYIEETRKFDDCITLRKYFYGRIKKGDNTVDVLRDTMIMSFDMTLKNLISEGDVINIQTVRSRNRLLIQ